MVMFVHPIIVHCSSTIILEIILFIILHMHQNFVIFLLFFTFTTR